MPELPDVEVFRRYLDHTSLNQKIDSLQLDEAGVLEGVSAKKLADRLNGAFFSDSARHGKHMFAELSNGGWLMLHFGMTGFLKYYKDEDSAPGHPRVIFRFDNGYSLAWDSQRMIGRVSLAESPEAYAEKNDLGPDAMDVSKEEFLELMRGKRGMIKTALMDQSLIAGIGNVYSDEMLFQTGVHPKTKVGDLSDDTLGKLHGNMRKVFEAVIESSIDPAEMPDWLMTAHRGRDNDCPGCKGKMEKIRISGRNGYICEKCQRK
jgi:formamidopyrimidine-DNA glycosylase